MNFKSIYQLLLLLTILAAFSMCSDKKETKMGKLPYLGRMEFVKEADGTVTDTVYHTIADFRLLNQDSSFVTNETFEGKIYIADFFFTSCPDICPKMKAQMLRVYDSINTVQDVAILSYTIDPKHDTVAVLKEFAERLGVESSKWHFVTGDKDEIYKLGQTSYLASMADDEGGTGITHSGKFFLIDKERRVRGAYEGTDPISVNDLIRDIHVLLKEYQ